MSGLDVKLLPVHCFVYCLMLSHSLYDYWIGYLYYICVYFRLIKVTFNETQNGTDTMLILVDFCQQVKELSRCLWLQNLGDQVTVLGVYILLVLVLFVYMCVCAYMSENFIALFIFCIYINNYPYWSNHKME